MRTAEESTALIERIARIDPKLHAYVGFDASDAQARANRVKAIGPLAGWSLAVKDIIDVAGLPTKCQVAFTSDQPATYNAVIVELLESLGCWVTGKTVTAAFAYFDPGPTSNPWNPAHTPGGSSSGSAAAVAAGLARLAIGTQTGGSINRPASFCGVVGFKPTFGTFSTEGVVPLAPSLDTVGLFTRNVEDMTTTISALLQKRVVQHDGPLNIAVVTDMYCKPPEDEMLRFIGSATNKLSQSGCHCEPVSLPVCCEEVPANHSMLFAYEAAKSHKALFDQHADEYSPKLRELIEDGQAVDPTTIAPIAEHQQKCAAEIERLLDNFDLLLSPSAPGAAPSGLSSTGDHRMNRLWTYTGLPSLTLPATLSEAGLPLGMQLVSKRFDEMHLLAMAKQVEASINFTQTPNMNWTADE